SLPVSVSQMPALQSGNPQNAATTRWPSGLKHTEQYPNDMEFSCLRDQNDRRVCCPRNLIVARGLPDTASQVRAVLSVETVATLLPSGLKVAEVICCSWPCRVATSTPVMASQMRAVLSAEAVSTRLPSGLKVADRTTASWPTSILCSRQTSRAASKALLASRPGLASAPSIASPRANPGFSGRTA